METRATTYSTKDMGGHNPQVQDWRLWMLISIKKFSTDYSVFTLRVPRSIQT